MVSVQGHAQSLKSFEQSLQMESMEDLRMMGGELYFSFDGIELVRHYKYINLSLHVDSLNR